MPEIQYWSNVKIARQGLPPGETFHITSLTHNSLRDFKPGVTCTAMREIAARRIAEGTHRLATPEEASAWDAQQESNAQSLRELELKRQLGQSPGVLGAQIATIAASLGAGDASRKPGVKG